MFSKTDFLIFRDWIGLSIQMLEIISSLKTLNIVHNIKHKQITITKPFLFKFQIKKAFTYEY